MEIRIGTLLRPRESTGVSDLLEVISIDRHGYGVQSKHNGYVYWFQRWLVGPRKPLQVESGGES